MVYMDAYRQQDYEAICTCGDVAGCFSDQCKHVLRVLLDCKITWDSYLKPWSNVKEWELQLGQRWTPPSAQELVRAVVVLQHSGQLLTLVQPVLTLSRAGRSKNFESASAEEVGRVKDLHIIPPPICCVPSKGQGDEQEDAVIGPKSWTKTSRWHRADGAD